MGETDYNALLSAIFQSTIKNNRTRQGFIICLKTT